VILKVRDGLVYLWKMFLSLGKSSYEDAMISNKDILFQAFGEVGVKEVPGKGDNPDIVKYHAFATRDNKVGMADSVPWCAAFMCWLLESLGLKSTNSRMARSFERLGKVIPIEDFLPGDLIVMFRNGIESGQGHVTVGLKLDSNSFGNKAWLLGGNQNDEVNIKKFALTNMTAIVRVSDKLEYSNEEKQELRNIANKMISNQETGMITSVV